MRQSERATDATLPSRDADTSSSIFHPPLILVRPLPNLGGNSYPSLWRLRWASNGLPDSRSILKWKKERRQILAVGEFRRCIETGVIGAGKIGVKRGSAKV